MFFNNRWQAKLVKRLSWHGAHTKSAALHCVNGCSPDFAMIFHNWVTDDGNVLAFNNLQQSPPVMHQQMPCQVIFCWPS